MRDQRISVSQRETKKTLNFRSRSANGLLSLRVPMTKRLLLSCVAVAALFSAGCHFFGKSRKPKENPAIATQVEIEFHQRWMAKRVGDLTAQGVAPAAAQEQAQKEYDQRFKYAQPEQK